MSHVLLCEAPDDLCSDFFYLFQVLVAQLDGEEQLPGPVEVTEDPAGQDVGFI